MLPLDIEDLSWREVLIWLLLPLCIGCMLLAGAHYLKKVEIVEDISDVPRIILTAVGAFVGGFSYLLLLWAIVAKVNLRRGINPHRKGLKESVVELVGVGAGFLPIAFWIWSANKMQKMEEDALAIEGVTSLFLLVREEQDLGRGRGYWYYFSAEGQVKRLHELRVKRHERGELKVGDSISILYLPANPTVFREADIPGDE